MPSGVGLRAPEARADRVRQLPRVPIGIVALLGLHHHADERLGARGADEHPASVAKGVLRPMDRIPHAFGGIQATIEEEARDRAEVLANGAAGELLAESGKMPQISVRVGEGVAVINEYLDDHPEVAALVLGAAAEGNPGPLISHFSANAGSLRCPLFIVPGALGEERIDELS